MSERYFLCFQSNTTLSQFLKVVSEYSHSEVIFFRNCQFRFQNHYYFSVFFECIHPIFGSTSIFSCSNFLGIFSLPLLWIVSFDFMFLFVFLLVSFNLLWFLFYCFTNFFFLYLSLKCNQNEYFSIGIFNFKGRFQITFSYSIISILQYWSIH